MEMSCSEARSSSYFYFDGALSEHECGAISGHISRCDACREHFDGIRSLNGLLGEWKTPPVSAGFPDRVMRSIRENAPGGATTAPRTIRRGFVRVPISVVIAASVLICVSVSFNFLWVLYRGELLERRGDSMDPLVPITAVDVEIDSPAHGPVRPAFYYFLDPRREAFADRQTRKDHP